MTLACLAYLWWTPAQAATIDLRSGESFEAAVESLAPGDTLIVHAGTYYDAGRVAITVKGTAALPVVIKAADGEVRPLIARRATDPVQNTIDVVGATYLTIQGLEITGVPGGDGVNLSGGPAYVTLQDLVIHDISVGVNFRSSMHHITVRRSQIYNTRDTGEGIYVGCHDGSCVVSDSLIDGNWIHDTRNSEQGDGIEIKKGSHSNVIRDNVIHDTFYPCLTLYGAPGYPPNIVERNVAWDCDDSAIQIAADAIVRNNLFIPGNGQGVSSQSSNGVDPANLQFLNNTIVGGSPCLRLSGWGGRPGMVFANNAVYCPNDSFVIGSMSGVTVSGNVFAPAISGMPASGYTLGRSLAEDFLDASARNLYPTASAPLLGTANTALQPSDDFNGTARLAPGDAGAYDWNGATNPGWTVVPGLKNVTPPGTVSFPTSLTVPVTDPDGSYAISWGASATAGVTYVLQEATDSYFTTGLRTAYVGSALSAVLSGRSIGVTYFYRIKATLTGSADSAWVSGGNGCAVTAAPASAVTLTPSVPSPATIGSTVTFNAVASGGSGTYEYMFLMRLPGGTLNTVRAYSTIASWTWNTTGLAAGTYQVVVRARNAGSTKSYEAYQSLSYGLGYLPASAVTLTPSVPSPATIGSTVTFNAVASGGSGTYEYMFLMRLPGGTLNTVRAYSTTASWNWNTTGLAAGTYQVVVRARNAGSTKSYEAYQSISYVLKAL